MASPSETNHAPQATVSPSDVYGSFDSFSEDFSEIDDPKNMAYLLLEFPDVSWAMRQPTVVLGRDEKLQRYLEDTQYLRIARAGGDSNEHGTTNHPTVGSDVSEGSPDESDVEDDYPGGTEFKYSPDGGCRTHLPLEYTDAQKGRGQEQFLAIHPPVDDSTGEVPDLTKISKQHVRLEVEENAVVLTVLGRNGLFLNDEYYTQDDQERVEDGDRIRIAGLDIYLRFNPATLMDDYDDDSGNASSQSDEEGVDGNSDSPDSSVERQLKSGHSLTKADRKRIKEAAENSETAKAKTSRTIKLSQLQQRDPDETKDQLKARLENLTGGQIQPRKGPGRPPANGLMSKRQMRELAKSAKHTGSGDTRGHVSNHSKSGPEPSKHVEGNESRDGAAKDKNKKRKRSETGADVKTSNGIDRKRKEESPRSPSPTEDQYTSEQLEHPGLTYVVMIHKILKDVEPKQLNLQQMYKEVKKRWPYYRFRKESSGWESSVRHTIKSNFFKQGERDGKGFKYTINPDQEPPAQKQKPTPAPPQPVPYANGQYPRGPPYGPPYNGQGYRPGYPAQAAYPPYPMQGQRPPGNGPMHSLQYPGPYNHQPNLQVRPINNGQPQPLATGQNGQGSQTGGSNNHLTTTNTNMQQNAQNIATAQQHHPSQQHPKQTQPNHTGDHAQPPKPTATPPLNHSTTPTQAPQPNVHQSLPHSHMSSSTLPLNNNHTQSDIPASSVRPNPQLHNPSLAATKTSSPSNTSHQAPGPANLANIHNKTPSQMPARPPSRSASTNISRPHTPASVALLPSEEVRQGHTPQVILHWKQKLLEPASNLPQHVMDEQTFRIDAAIGWYMKNPDADIFKATPEVQGSWKNLVPLIQNMIREHDKAGLSRRQQQHGQKA